MIVLKRNFCGGPFKCQEHENEAIPKRRCLPKSSQGNVTFYHIIEL